MRWLSLLLLTLTAYAAEYQQLTFSDGSVKIGWFDERRATLTLGDGSTIAVKVDDIVRRETVSPERKPLDIPPPVRPPDQPPHERGDKP